MSGVPLPPLPPGPHSFTFQAWDVLNLTGLMFNHMLTLPLTNVQTVAWSLRSIPIFGSLLWAFTLGFSLGWTQSASTSDYPTFLGTPLFINATAYDVYCDSFWSYIQTIGTGLLSAIEDANPFASTNSGRVPMSAFYGDVDEVGQLLGSSSLSHAVTFQLTDKCNLEEWDNATADSSTQPSGTFTKCSTLYLGQLSAQGTGNTRYMWNPWKSTQLSSYDPGPFVTDTNGCGNYIIDAIGIYSLGKAPIRITAFSADPTQVNPYNTIIWQTTLQSQSMFSGNIRDWLTVYKTSYLDDFIEDNIKYTFPQALNPPAPGTVLKQPIQIPNTNWEWNLLADLTTDLSLGPQTVDKSFKDADHTQVLFDFGTLGYTTWNEVIQDYSSLNINWNIQLTYQFAQLQGEQGPIITDESYTVSPSLTNQQFTLGLSAISATPTLGPNGIVNVTGFFNGIPATGNIQNTSYPVPDKKTDNEVGIDATGLINNTAFSTAFTVEGVKLIWNRQVNCVALKGNQNGGSIWQASKVRSYFLINGDITITTTGS